MIYSIINVLFSSTSLTVLFIMSVFYAVSVAVTTSDRKKFMDFQADIHNNTSLVLIIGAILIAGAIMEITFLILFTKALISAGIIINSWISALIVLALAINCYVSGLYFSRSLSRISWIPLTAGISSCLIGFCLFFTVF